MRPLAPSIAIALLCASPAAAAGPSITLNGVAIDGVTNQKFDNCTVVIDEAGNVHIRARGYAVRNAGDDPRLASSTSAQGAGSGGNVAGRAAGMATAPARLTRRYFLAAEQTPPGAQYDLGIFINAQWIREVKASDPSAVMEITKYLRPGANKVTLSATKRIQGERLSFSREVALKVVVGEGNVDANGEHVMIDVPLVEVARTAAEMDDKLEEFVIDAR